MFKTFLTLMRGAAAQQQQDFADRHALLLLDQHMRDSAAALERSKRALAVAMAQDQQEAARLDATLAKIADLEARVTAALAAGRDDLALQGAEAIAALEADRDSAATARALFAAETARMRRHVGEAEARIAALDRGRRIARVSESIQAMNRGRVQGAATHEATMAEAEATLKRLRERQAEAMAADAAYEEMDGAHGPAAIAEKLAREGFGPRTRPQAQDVLARLKAKMAQAA